VSLQKESQQVRVKAKHHETECEPVDAFIVKFKGVILISLSNVPLFGEAKDALNLDAEEVNHG